MAQQLRYELRMQASFNDGKQSWYEQESPDNNPERAHPASHHHVNGSNHGAIELRHLRYFVAVAEHGHFGRAARSLNVSQPPLSRQIRDLERHLGVELLDRTSSGVSLTEPGKRMLHRSRRVLAEFSRAIEFVRQGDL